jgi:hypothetical protein
VGFIRAKFPPDIPENFIAMMSPAFMCGVEETLKRLGWVVKDVKREENVKPA